MTAEQPRRTVRYDGKMIRSSRWDGLKPRPDDIFVCTPPKSGTTWMQAICAFLIFGRPDLSDNPGNLSPWVDAEFEPAEAMHTRLDAQRHRRFMKTHTPLDGIPYVPPCHYLAVYRDPRDVYFSMRNHAGNMRFPAFAELFAGTPDADFRTWVESPYRPGDGDAFSLAGIVHHYRSFRQFSGLGNVSFFHYADMLADRAGVMTRVADALGITVDHAVMPALVEAAGFANMRENAERFAPNAGTGRWKDERRFFNRGSSAQWREMLSDGTLELYDNRLSGLLPESDIAWLQYGSGNP